MPCPDELTLNLWLADALPSEEAATIATHVATCRACSAARQAIDNWGAELHESLALNAEELAYVSGLELASTWRASSAAGFAWGWIALIGVMAGFAAWLFAAPMVGSVVVVAARVGVFSVLLNATLSFALGVGQVLLDLVRSPALGWSQPLLALLALALLFWPRHLISQRSTPS